MTFQRLRPVLLGTSVGAGLLATIFGAAPVRAQATTPTHHQGLGSLAFPTSGAPEARPAFERGVLLLHSFEYEQAAEAFLDAQRIDPDFAMAYWGEAMTHNHPVWDEQDRESARAALARFAPTADARAAKAPTPRERAWIEAVDVLYGEGTKAERDTSYARSMEALARAWPDDYEARAFHALAILGLSRGSRDVPSYMRAGAIALDLFEQNPLHPGAAHYVIHAFDDPTHAPLGLEAAEAYAEVAPEAAHAQHMTTHIFLALGMWDGVVEANERADGVVDRARVERGEAPTDCGHYNQWLAYGYQQQGRYGDSQALVLGCYEETGPAAMASAVYMRALHLASSDETEGPVVRASVQPVEEDGDPRIPSIRAVQSCGTGWAAARRGDPSTARTALRALEEELEGDPELISWWASYAPVWLGTLRSAVAAAEGDLDRAVTEARQAAEYEADLPVDFGPPVSFKPPRELEGEMLLEAGRADEAVTAFRGALSRTPRRARALMGLVEAAEAAGEPALAESARRELRESAPAARGK